MKNWNDQPSAVEGTSVLCSFFMNGIGQVIEVRKSDEGVYFLTIGNLFGSQTVKVPDADTVFRMIEMINQGGEKSQRKHQPMVIPPGCEVME